MISCLGRDLKPAPQTVATDALAAIPADLSYIFVNLGLRRPGCGRSRAGISNSNSSNLAEHQIRGLWSGVPQRHTLS